MGSDVARSFASAIGVRDEARAYGEQPLDHYVFPRPVFEDAARAAQSAALTDTRVAQPAIGAVTASHLALWKQLGLFFDAAAGHSFGEPGPLRCRC